MVLNLMAFVQNNLLKCAIGMFLTYTSRTKENAHHVHLWTNLRVTSFVKMGFKLGLA